MSAASTATKSRPQRASLVERTYREIKRRILDNHYPPGLRVLEQDLAGQLGVSRTPVREALIRLENEGLVEVLPRRGMRVLPISPDDMHEVYEVLMCLESRAAERLAERRPTAVELAPLIGAVEAMERALAAEDLDAWAEADARFHRLLLELAGNRRLAAMALTLFDQVHRARMATLRIRAQPRQSNRDHRAVVEAILEGDGPRAHEIHYRHRERAMGLLTGLLRRHKLSRL
jgi:DNA-binding GntR family transcriptional regulator